VRAGQGEVREAVVVEASRLPVVHVVAGFTGGGKPGRHVVDAAGLLELSQVARYALRAQPGVLAGSRAAMAGIAGYRSVRSQQRKAVLVVLDRACGYSPTLHGVAVFALRAELAAVEIGMACRALGSGFREYSRYVAGVAPDVFVHATQSELGFAIVIEFHLRAQGRPTGGRMAVFAGDGDGAVRIPRRLRRLRTQGRQKRQRH